MNKKILVLGKNLPWIILSAILQAFSLSSFCVPGNIYSGGVMGFSRLFSDVLLDFFNINIIYTIPFMIINIVFVIIVFKKVGKIFTVLSLIQTGLVSLIATYMKPLISLDDMLLLSVFGGIINGFAVSLALTHNASSGGTDFLTIFFSDKYKKAMWNYLLAFNTIVIISSGILYDWQRAFYSIIFQFCSTQVVNRMHKRYSSQTITVITSMPDEVSNDIFSTIRHGITEINAMGEYKKTQTHMLYTVVNSYQTDDVIRSILKVDPNAFINVQDTKVVIGNYYQKPLD